MTGTLRATDSSLSLGPTVASDTLGRPVRRDLPDGIDVRRRGQRAAVRDGGIHEFPAGHVVQTDVQAIVTGEVARVRMEGGEIVRLEGSRPREHEQMRAQQAEVVVDGGGGRLRALADGLAHERLFVFGGTEHEEAAECQQRQDDGEDQSRHETGDGPGRKQPAAQPPRARQSHGGASSDPFCAPHEPGLISKAAGWKLSRPGVGCGPTSHREGTPS